MQSKILLSEKAPVVKKRRLEDEIDDRQIGGASADFDDDYPSPCEFSQMSRSERKRHREKKRRNQVNAGFDDLKDLLLRIDPETSDRGDEINRVDLIGRAVMVMRKLKNDNEALRRQWTEQQSKDSITNTNDDTVTIAIPYLVPKERQYMPPPRHHHSTSHHAPPQHHRHHHRPDDPVQLHHQYQYHPPPQGQLHAPHPNPYHHHDGHREHAPPPYYGDGYSR